MTQQRPLSRWRWVFVWTVILLPLTARAELVATFEDVSLGSDGYYNGSDGAGGFQSGGIQFVNNYNATWGSWDGWAGSSKTDTTTAGWANQYSVYTGSAAFGSQFGVYYEPEGAPATVSLQGGGTGVFEGAYFTNTTYTALSMLNGDAFSKKFGGATGNDPDYFLLTITGLDSTGSETGSIDFYLADYRFDNNRLDYVLDKWIWVDLTGLGEVASLEFDLSSTDVGSYGMNTPAFFAMDNLTVTVPEPGTLVLSLLGVCIGIGGWQWKLRRERKRE